MMYQMLPNRKVKISVYPVPKWNISTVEMLEDRVVEPVRVEFDSTDIDRWEVAKRPDAEVLAEGFEECDPVGEYLTLYFKNGEVSTYRNSYCDMFICH